MYHTVKALVLRDVNYKEADKILTLLTDELGKITASARGCRRSKSQLTAGIQLLTWSELVIYERQGRWQVKEATPLRHFQGVRDDLERLSLACYFSEAVELSAVEGLPANEMLSLMLNSLHALDKMQEKPLALIKGAFELRLLCLSGYEPMLDGCTVCEDEPEVPRFFLKAGALHCAPCRTALGDGIAMPISPTVLQAMRFVAWADPKRLFSFSLDTEGLYQFATVTEAYLLTQLERGFHTLDFYKSLILRG